LVRLSAELGWVRRIQIVVLLLALAVSALALATSVTISASGDTLSVVGAPEPLRISGDSGDSISASILVHVSNATRLLSINNVSSTVLQDTAGHQIPASSVTITPSSFPIPVETFVSLTVTVHIPGGTTPGNYSGQILMLVSNGSVATATIRLIVEPPWWTYLASLAATGVGVALSFIYSPYLDPESKKDKNESKKGEVKLELSWTGKDWWNGWDGLKGLKARKHLTLVGASITLSFVAFSYLLFTQSDFGVSILRVLATAFLQGFLIHRGLDGLAPKIFK